MGYFRFHSRPFDGTEKRALPPAVPPLRATIIIDQPGAIRERRLLGFY